ncbi:unnamed protein product [Ectocarpus sp. 6 AP-2014]
MAALSGSGLARTFLDMGVLGVLLVGAALVILVRTTWKKKRDEGVAEPAVDTAELRRKRMAMLGSQVNSTPIERRATATTTNSNPKAKHTPKKRVSRTKRTDALVHAEPEKKVNTVASRSELRSKREAFVAAATLPPADSGSASQRDEDSNVDLAGEPSSSSAATTRRAPRTSSSPSSLPWPTALADAADADAAAPETPPSATETEQPPCISASAPLTTSLEGSRPGQPSDVPEPQPSSPAAAPAAVATPAPETPPSATETEQPPCISASAPMTTSLEGSKPGQPSDVPEPQPSSPAAAPAAVATPLATGPAPTPPPPPPHLPGWMQLSELLELLESGARPAYEALIGIVCVDEVGNDHTWRSRGDGPAGPDTTAGVCRRWWDAASGAGEVEAARVAADVLGLHLDAMQNDLFSSADEQGGALLLAFLGTSPSPLMVRHVFLGNPSAARASLRLAVAVLSEVRGEAPPPGAQVPAGRRGTRATAASANATAWADTARRLEAWQPLEGLESLERLLRSAAGAAALVAVLGLEARREYAHGAEFEAESVLGSLLGGLSCVLTLNEHLRAAQEIAGANPYSSGSPSLGNQTTQQLEEEAWKRVPAAHKLARRLAVLRKPGPRARNAAVHEFNASVEMAARNRQSFVALVEGALVKAMTTKGVARESKSDVCAWLSKAIFLHEGLPEMCEDHSAPELLGGEGSTCASSGFLMSFSALLLRMGVGLFSSVCPKSMDLVEIDYVEGGSVNWSSGLPAASIDDDDDPGDCEGDEEVGHGDGNVGGGVAAAAEATPPHESGGVEEEKDGGAGEPRESSGEAAAAATICGSGDDVGNEVASAAAAAAAADDEGEEEEREQEEPPRRGFSFATELFFLTHRALQVIISPLDRRRGEMRKRISDIALARTGLSLSGDDDAEGEDEAGRGMAGFALKIFKEANSAISLAWSVEGFGSDAVTGHACQLALFSASWLELYIGEGNATNSSNFLRSPSGASLPVAAAEGSASAAAAAATSVSKIAPPLIETICASWVRGASNGRDEQFLSRRAAEDAATFCGKIMERVDLRLSPVTQNKLVGVLETLIQTGTWALENDRKGRRGSGRNGPVARSGGFRGSMYWGNRRGYAGAILDSGELRTSLPRQLMRLYASVQQIEGMAATEYIGYFKFSVRVRVGTILLQLWSHPLGEPRQVILDLVRASMATSTTAASTPPSPDVATATGGVSMSGGGGGGGGRTMTAETAPTDARPLATEFFISAFDTINYFFNLALDHLRDGVIEERGNGGRSLEAGHEHWRKYMSDRKQVVSALKNMTVPVLTLLTTLGEEKEVMDALRVAELGARSAALLSGMLRSLYGEESAAFAVADPNAWGFDKTELGGMACDLLVGLTAHGDAAPTRAFAAALHHADSEFDGRLLEAVAAGEGGAGLGGTPALARLTQALEADDEDRRTMEEQAAAAAVAGEGGQGSGGSGDPFEGVPEVAADDEELVHEYGDAIADLVHTQVESLSPGHYFDSRREGSTLTHPRKVATEIMRKLPRMLPNPPHPNSAVFAVVEEDALNFSRFVISGPVDTPYEGGLFVFDVFLPSNYPADPPLVQMITTGQGTVKFNVNLYSDGKVCLSLLGSATGASASGGDKWNPETSSLWQVFASIQTQVLVKDPYYNEGGGRSNMRGRGTAETEEASAHENARVTLETIRHAAVANLRHPPKGCEKLIRQHFHSLRKRVLARCRRAVEEAPNERLKRATLRASAELRAEMDKLPQQLAGEVEG